MYKGIIKRWVKSVEVGYDGTMSYRMQYENMLQAKAKVKSGPENDLNVEDITNRQTLRRWREYLRDSKRPLYYFGLRTGEELTSVGRPTAVDLCFHIMNAVHNYRARHRPVPQDLTPNRMLRRLKAIKKSHLRESKSPKTVERHVGIEIEFLSPMERSEIEDLLIEAKLEHTCTIKDDGSVEDADGGSGCNGSQCTCESCNEGECCGECADGGDNGHELTVLATEKTYRKVLKQVSEVLKEAKAWVNSSCGLHVHLDARSRSRLLMYDSLVWALPALCKVVPKSRVENRFCRINRLDTRCVDRYYAVNPKAYEQYQTIEVRLHSGTTDPRKITHWIATLIRLCDKKVYKHLDDPQPTTVGALKAFLPKQTYRYLVQRQQHFRNIHAEETR